MGDNSLVDAYGERKSNTHNYYQHIPEQVLDNLKHYSGRLASEAVAILGDRLVFFSTLNASQRASVALIIQTAIVNFAEWMHNPHQEANHAAQVFQLASQDLTRTVALKHTVEMVQVIMDFFEHRLAVIPPNNDQMTHDQLTTLMLGIVEYSRDFAFTAALAYAEAAETRGTWDRRIEASIVDAIVRGDQHCELFSQAATLNWDSSQPVTVLVGVNPACSPHWSSWALIDRIHQLGNTYHRASLAGVHGNWLIVLVAEPVLPTQKFLGELLDFFDEGPVVISSVAANLSYAHHSASEALMGMQAVQGWTEAPRPVLAKDLLPERVLMGDPLAIQSLYSDIIDPLSQAGTNLLDTLESYLSCGGAIDACAQKLFVHPNTVRYRLKRITEYTGRDPLHARDAYVLHIAMSISRLRSSSHLAPPHSHP